MFNYISALLNLLLLIALSGVLCSNYNLRRLLSWSTSKLENTIVSNNNHIIALKKQIKCYEDELTKSNKLSNKLLTEKMDQEIKINLLKTNLDTYSFKLEENAYVIKRFEENQETNLKQISLLKAHIQRLNKQLENNDNIGR